MTDQADRGGVQQLIEKWKRVAGLNRGLGKPWRLLQQCADELESALQEAGAAPAAKPMVCPCCDSDGLTGWKNIKTEACGIVCLDCGCEFDQKIEAASAPLESPQGEE